MSQRSRSSRTEAKDESDEDVEMHDTANDDNKSQGSQLTPPPHASDEDGSDDDGGDDGDDSQPPPNPDPANPPRRPGRVTRLAMKNFKSYKDTVISPFHAFTCVIGPNGSGKSNLMDSISFVLGVRTQQLRSRHREDLIFRPSEDPENKEGRIASVEFTYTFDDHEEIVFRRQIHPDGRTTNAVNGAPCSLKEYKERLSQIGVLVEARNFLVFQGDVESVAQKDGRQLAEWVEEISGSKDLKAEYEAKLQEKNQLDVEFDAMCEKTRNFTRERKQMSLQRAEALEFQETENALHAKKSEFYRWQLYNATHDIATAQEGIRGADEVIATLQEECDEVEAKENEEKNELATINRRLLAMKKNIRKQKKTMEKERLSLNTAETRVDSLNKKIEKEEGELARSREREEEREKRIEELEAKIAEVADERKELERQQAESEEVELEESQYEEYQRAKDEAEKETASMKPQLEKLRTAFERANDEQTNLENEIASLEERKADLSQDAARVEERLQGIDGERKQVEVDLAAVTEEFEDHKHKFDQFEKERRSLNNRMERIQQEIQNAHIHINEDRREREMNEVLQSMMKLYSGVHGRMTDLVRAHQAKHNTAVAVALGRFFDAIVVENKHVAFQCIKYMKQQRKGQAMFIPINDIREPEAIRENLRRLGGSAQLVYDLLEFDRDIERAVRHVVGNTVVVDSVDEARNLGYNSGHRRLRIVALDGTLIAPNGNMTGGFGDDMNKKARRWDERAAREKQQERDQVMKKLQQLNHQLEGEKSEEELRANMEELQNQSNELGLRSNALGEQLKTKRDTLKQINKEIKAKKRLVSKATKATAAARDALQEFQDEMNAKRDEIFAEFADSVGDIRKFEEEKLERVQQRIEERSRLQQQQEMLQNKLEFERGKDASQATKQQEKKLKKLRSDLKKAETALKKVRKSSGNATKKLSELESSYEDVQESMQEQKRVVDDIKKDVTKKREAIRKHEKMKSDFEARIEKLRLTEENIKDQADLDHINLFKTATAAKNRRKRRRATQSKKRRKRRRTESGESAESSGDEDEDAKQSEVDSSDVEMEDTSGRRRKRGRATGSQSRYDFDEFEDEGPTDSPQEYNRRINQYKREIEEMEQKLNEIAPNFKSIDQFKAIDKNAKSARAEQKNLRKRLEAAMEAFENVKDRRTQIFMSAFTHIQEQINEIYKQLTRSSQNRFGGQAYLDLVETLEPYKSEILYNAQPLGKRFTSMDHLSGGEKSVASLALLFAIHSFKPAPFFVLDEVDAALDSVNVNKVSNYIRYRAQHDNLQMIVISLKDKFFRKADALVGVYKDRESESSDVLTLDLDKFAE